MKNSNIKITSKGQGWEEKFSAACRAERNDGLSQVNVFYKNDGDECKLSLGENYVQMSREGKTPLNMSFIRGRHTACSVGGGALFCELDCLTTFLEVKQFTHGIRVKLNYTLSESPVFLEAIITF